MAQPIEFVDVITLDPKKNYYNHNHLKCYVIIFANLFADTIISSALS